MAEKNDALIEVIVSKRDHGIENSIYKEERKIVTGEVTTRQ